MGKRTVNTHSTATADQIWSPTLFELDEPQSRHVVQFLPLTKIKKKQTTADQLKLKSAHTEVASFVGLNRMVRHRLEQVHAYLLEIPRPNYNKPVSPLRVKPKKKLKPLVTLNNESALEDLYISEEEDEFKDFTIRDDYLKYLSRNTS